MTKYIYRIRSKIHCQIKNSLSRKFIVTNIIAMLESLWKECHWQHSGNTSLSGQEVWVSKPACTRLQPILLYLREPKPRKGRKGKVRKRGGEKTLRRLILLTSDSINTVILPQVAHHFGLHSTADQQCCKAWIMQMHNHMQPRPHHIVYTSILCEQAA